MGPHPRKPILDNFQLNSLIWYTIQFLNYYSPLTELDESPGDSEEMLSPLSRVIDSKSKGYYLILDLFIFSWSNIQP